MIHAGGETVTTTAPCFRAVFEDIDEHGETVLLVVDRGRPVGWRGNVDRGASCVAEGPMVTEAFETVAPAGRFRLGPYRSPQT